MPNEESNSSYSYANSDFSGPWTMFNPDKKDFYEEEPNLAIPEK